VSQAFSPGFFGDTFSFPITIALTLVFLLPSLLLAFLKIPYAIQPSGYCASIGSILVTCLYLMVCSIKGGTCLHY
jgi:hypothetical protein